MHLSKISSGLLLTMLITVGSGQEDTFSCYSVVVCMAVFTNQKSSWQYLLASGENGAKLRDTAVFLGHGGLASFLSCSFHCGYSQLQSHVIIFVCSTLPYSAFLCLLPPSLSKIAISSSVTALGALPL